MSPPPSPYRAVHADGRRIMRAGYHQAPSRAGLHCGYVTADINARCGQATLDHAPRIMATDLELALPAAGACAYPDYPTNAHIATGCAGSCRPWRRSRCPRPHPPPLATAPFL